MRIGCRLTRGVERYANTAMNFLSRQPDHDSPRASHGGDQILSIEKHRAQLKDPTSSNRSKTYFNLRPMRLKKICEFHFLNFPKNRSLTLAFLDLILQKFEVTLSLNIK